MADNIVYHPVTNHYDNVLPLVPVHQWIFKTPSSNGPHPCETAETDVSQVPDPTIYLGHPAPQQPGLYYIQTQDGQILFVGNEQRPITPRSLSASNSANVRQRRQYLYEKYQERQSEWTVAESLLDLNGLGTYLPPRINGQHVTTPKRRGYISKAVRRLIDYFDQETPYHKDEVNEGGGQKVTQYQDEVLLDDKYDDITDSEWDTDDENEEDYDSLYNAPVPKV